MWLNRNGGVLANELTSIDSASAKRTSAQDAWYPSSKKDVSVLVELVSKDFKLKYRRSVLGVIWSVLNPLLMMAVMALVFSHMMRGADESIANFPLYLIIGNTAFQFMSDSTNTGMRSIIDAAPLLKKVKVNRYVFPVQKVLFACVNYLFSMIAVALVMLFYSWPVTVNVLFFPLFVLYLTGFCIGLSLLLSAASVFFRDVIHLWGVVLTAWTYATPLFYSIKILPEWLQNLEAFNPMYRYVSYVRDILLNGVTPSLEANLVCAGFALCTLAIGWFVFKRTERKFILYI